MTKDRLERKDVGRARPARGVYILSGQPTIVFLTVCTKDRSPWLADEAVHRSLRQAWEQAPAWLVGYYLLMPDHLHLFCAPRDLSFTLERWVTFWKRGFRRLHNNPECRWQSHCFDCRLRRQESYTEKWTYVRENPFRKKFVTKAENWPYQGMLNLLRW
jgi:putative transposase